MRFRVLTFVTDFVEYERMRESFARAGFSPEVAEFQFVDNSQGNVSDPFSLLNSVLGSMPEFALVVCHQDVRLDLGAGYQDLVTGLSSLDNGWGVAGPAGISDDYRQVLAIQDPWNAPLWHGEWPVPVQALDELLIVIRPGRSAVSDGLSGFHFYGADLCLAAKRLGFGAYAVDFPLTHLSDGRRGQLSQGYRSSRSRFQAQVSRHYRFTLVVTSTGEAILLSRWLCLRDAADRPRVHALLKWWFARRTPGRAID